jgi:catechol 2,3-dioxygenase-like lactoylglutathione lyase family enzyme
MLIDSCVPVIPSADLEKSLHFWVDWLGLPMDRAMRQNGRLIGCMVHNERLYFWLNQRAGSPIKPENYEGRRVLEWNLCSVWSALAVYPFDASGTNG